MTKKEDTPCNDKRKILLAMTEWGDSPYNNRKKILPVITKK
jgi:hypothetical protein